MDGGRVYAGTRTFTDYDVSGHVQGNGLTVGGTLTVATLDTGDLAASGTSSVASITTGDIATAGATVTGTGALGSVAATGDASATTISSAGAGAFGTVTTPTLTGELISGSATTLPVSPTVGGSAEATLTMFDNTATTAPRVFSLMYEGSEVRGSIVTDDGIANNGLVVRGPEPVSGGLSLWLRTTEDSTTRWIRVSGPKTNTGGGALWNQLGSYYAASQFQAITRYTLPGTYSLVVANVFNSILIGSANGTWTLPTVKTVAESPPVHGKTNGPTAVPFTCWFLVDTQGYTITLDHNDFDHHPYSTTTALSNHAYVKLIVVSATEGYVITDI